MTGMEKAKISRLSPGRLRRNAAELTPEQEAQLEQRGRELCLAAGINAGERMEIGLDDGRARTLEEVGKEFNVTRERIRQIEAKALRKLRHPSRSRKLKDYLD